MIPAIQAENGGAFYSDNFIHIFYTGEISAQRWTIPVHAVIYANTSYYEETKTLEIRIVLKNGEEIIISKYENNRIEVIVKDYPLTVGGTIYTDTG